MSLSTVAPDGHDYVSTVSDGYDYLDTGPYKAALGSLFEELTVERLRVLVDDVAARVPLATTAARPELAHIDAVLLGWAVRAIGEEHFATRKYARVHGRKNKVIPAGYEPYDPRWIDEVVRFPMCDLELAEHRAGLIFTDNGRRERGWPPAYNWPASGL